MPDNTEPHTNGMYIEQMLGKFDIRNCEAGKGKNQKNWWGITVICQPVPDKLTRSQFVRFPVSREVYMVGSTH